MSDLFRGAERLMGMDDAAWARHANPLSVWTRIAGGSAVFLALWSVHWIGAWSAVPIVAALVWVWANPRLFRPPETAGSWAARGVLGERAFLNRRAVPVPDEHRRVAWAATAAALGFVAVSLLGFLRGEFWTAFAGWHAATLAKLWFVDRMAWLWDLMKDTHPAYRAWARADWSARLEG